MNWHVTRNGRIGLVQFVTKCAITQIALPFLKNPEQNPELEPYFNKQWVDMLNVSLQNFLSTSILAMNKPHLLIMETELKVQYFNISSNIE